MKREARTFGELEKDLSRIFHKKEDGIIVVDLGAMIDLQRQSEKQKEDIVTYMAQLEKYGLPVVTNATLVETEAHLNMKINSRRRELSPCVYGFAKIYNVNFYEAVTKLDSAKRNMADYDAWLLIRNHIKPIVEASDTSRYDLVSNVDQDIAMNSISERD